LRGDWALLIRRDYSGSRAGAIETVNCWAAVFLLLGLAALPPFLFLRALPAESWLASSTAVIIGVAGAHATALVLTMALRAAGWVPRKRPRLVFSRASQSACLILMLALASFTLFWIDPANRYFSTIIKFFLEPPFKQPGGTGLAGTFVGAALGIGCVAVLIWLEALLRRQFPEATRIATAIVLAVTVVTTFVFYFDFSLTADTFHYMTNVGPALATLHGATPMVDAFSQYGPGPLLATLVGFRFGPITFGTAQIVAQVFNLAFYGLWLVCLPRLTHSKLAALLLGFAAIALYFSLWERGVGNINDAPSARSAPSANLADGSGAFLPFCAAPTFHVHGGEHIHFHVVERRNADRDPGDSFRLSRPDRSARSRPGQVGARWRAGGTSRSRCPGRDDVSDAVARWNRSRSRDVSAFYFLLQHAE
jgi:hypothetical protein